MVPGLHLTTVGTVRDGAKWPNRDRRKGIVKRDVISFEVFSPYTVGKMLKASAVLKTLQANTDRSIDEVSIGGALVKRLILRASRKYFRTGIEMYLLEKVIEKAEKSLSDAGVEISTLFTVDADAVYSDEWLDIGGQLMPRQRLRDLEDAIESGRISTITAFNTKLKKISRAYTIDEWFWVKSAYKQVFDLDLANAVKDDIMKAAQMFLKAKSKFLKLVAADAEKEFDELSHTGFGQDGSDDDIEKDFYRVRGRYDENKFVRELKNSIEKLQQRIERFERRLSGL